MIEPTSETPHHEPKPVEYIPPPARLGWGRWALSRLPGFCNYCGRWRVPIHGGGGRVTMFSPLGASGRACPHAHEGYLDTFIPAGAVIRETFDLVKNPEQREP